MLPCPRCKDIVDPEEYRFCPNCGAPLVLPQEPAAQPVVQEEIGTEPSAQQPPKPQEMQPQVRTPEVQRPVEAPQAPQTSPVTSVQQSVPAAPTQPAASNPQFTPPQASPYQQPAPQPMPQPPYCAPQGQQPVYAAPPQFPPQGQPGYPQPQNQSAPYQPVYYYYPPVQHKRPGNGPAVTGLVFGATSLAITLFVLLALLSGAAVPEGTLTFLIALAGPGEVLGIITVCRKSPKKILGILSLSFAAAVHLICITANMISRL